jgi:hypothetical protein
VRTSFLAEYHQPFGLRWQLGASHRAQVAEAGEFVTATTVLSATYMVSDRWIGGVSGLHALRTTGHGSALSVDVWTVQLSAEIHYFVEDSWTLSVRARGSQSNSPDLFSRFGSIELGITRLFSGLFELPGIVSAMRPTPPAP